MEITFDLAMVLLKQVSFKKKKSHKKQHNKKKQRKINNKKPKQNTHTQIISR